jgi:sugar lactone lactonase YvrE
MVWPNQDYFDLELHYKQIWENPGSRIPLLNAFFQIWLNRDFQPYAEVTGRPVSLENWSPGNTMRMYIRKDVASQIWSYGVPTGDLVLFKDPFEDKQLSLSPLFTINNLELNGPHGIALAPDGTLYITDTGNNRVIHIDTEGNLLNEWGGYGTINSEEEIDGLFDQPWGIAVDAEGFVYVADVWNHRIQKFDSEGKFITKWGFFGQGLNPGELYGPRDIVINQYGNLLITDTGNKRILMYSPDGELITQFGTGGYLEGQFDEPVGLAISPVTGELFVADTWNQRLQVWEAFEGDFFIYRTSWDIFGWYGQTLENKPYLAVDEFGRIYAADPEGGRVLVFSPDGEALGYWGSFDFGPQGFGLVSGLATDGKGGIWITDGLRNVIHYYPLP